MYVFKRMIVGAILLALVACSNEFWSVPHWRGPTTPALRTSTSETALRTCRERSNDTLAKLEACIQRTSLWRTLTAFQSIADQHPDSSGHGNRDTGTPGYAASVRYVAALMRRAGYHVTIQRYTYRASQRTAVDFLRRYRWGSVPPPSADVSSQRASGIDYNVIADSPYGNPRRTIVVDAHLDSIFGAGMLDNASGSASVLEVALAMAKTPTINRLRYIWFGGEELGLLGSQYYTTHLGAAQLQRTAFDVDVDVTATPNFDVLVADPALAGNHDRFPPNVVPESRIGNALFADFFRRGGVVSRAARFGNDGTDSNSFSLVGVANSGILTQQDCCKQPWETALWGGFLGNYEGVIPSFNGGCVDRPHRWCDNLSNNDPFVLELASKAVAHVTFELANDPSVHR